MWEPWSGLLEALGRIRFGFRRARDVSVGDPRATDARGGPEWKRFLRAEDLHRVWGPPSGSPWVPFHCVPLFAALDRIPANRVGPTPPSNLPPPVVGAEPARGEADLGGGPGAEGGAGTEGGASAEGGASPAGGASAERSAGAEGGGRAEGSAEAEGSAGAEGAAEAEGGPDSFMSPRAHRAEWPPAAPSWHDRSTWTILDLPGRRSVEAAVWLIEATGCQPICTFDNWPHQRGVIRAEEVLAELLRWASTVEQARARLTFDSPPLWICDSRRLGTGPGSPGEFDNRYYLDDSILPGPMYLRRHGVGRVVYVTWRSALDVPLADLEGYFADLLRAGFPVLHRDLSDAEGTARPLSAPAKPRPPPRRGFRRSAAGGFGTTVPEPSSSGG